MGEETAIPITFNYTLVFTSSSFDAVNNAVCNFFTPFETLDIDSGRKVMEINLFGHARLIHLLIPGMKERRHGRIISIGSIGAVGCESR